MDLNVTYNKLIQKVLGVPQTGQFDNATYHAASDISERYVGQGSRTHIVAAVQMLCNRAFRRKIKVDGIFGPVTLDRLLKLTDVPQKRPDKVIAKSSQSLIQLLRSDDHIRENDLLPKRDTRSMSMFYGVASSISLKPQRYLSTQRVPYPLMFGHIKITRITLHKKIIDQAMNALSDVLNIYGKSEINRLGLNQYSGSYNYRPMRGGRKMSTHAYGAATDWHSNGNGLRTPFRDSIFSGDEYIPFLQCWYNQGAINLGVEFDFDSMHMQFTRR